MTVSQLLHQAEKILNEGGCDSPSFDAVCLVEDIGKIGRGAVPLKKDAPVPEHIQQAVLKAANCRAKGYPLQYLIGSWDFLNLTLEVGEGVLIPRPETELLCEAVAQKAKEKWGNAPLTVWDLCAGTGCVGLGIASLLNSADISVVEFEISDRAFSYLEKNIASHKQFRASLEKANVLTDHSRYDGPVDILVSNPPYIPKSDLEELQREVRHEPTLALDGGVDGLCFYRAIANCWIPKIRSGGIAAVEIGIGQSEAVVSLFEQAGLRDVEVLKDFSDIERVVIGAAPKYIA